MILLAHPGHWAVQLLYLAPLVVMGVLFLAGRFASAANAMVSVIRDARSA